VTTYPANFIEITYMVQQIQQFKLYANVYKDLFSLVIETKVE